MRKFTFILSLLVAFVTTAMAQGTILSSSELNALASSKKVAVKNLSGTNNRWLALTSSVVELTPEAVLVVEPIGDGTFYLKRAYEDNSYVQAASGVITLGAKETAQVFTTTAPSTTGSDATNFNGEALAEGSDLDNLVRFVQDGAGSWLNCQNQANAPVLGNTGKGGWTVHNVYDMSNAYRLTINSKVGDETTTKVIMVEAGAAITVEDKDGYTHDFVAQNMPAADTEITVTYTVDENVETPEPTYLVNISTEENRKYYKIGSYNRGGFLSSVGDGAAVEHVDETDASYWYFIEAPAKDGGVYFRNYTTEQYLGSDMKMSAEPAVWYILENGVNNEGYSICKTNAIGGGCIDANNYNTGVGTWNPSATDWHGTTWVFVAVDPDAEKVALEAAKAELTATAASATAILTAANLSVSATPVTLTVGNLSSNAVEEYEGSLDALLDGDPSTFFHSRWNSNGVSDDGQDHYLLVDLGEGKSITNLQFNYHTRQGVVNDFPVDIVVAGSNNGTEFTEITTIKDIPVVTADKDYISPAIVNATAYRYIRLMVTKTNYDRVSTGVAHNYWHMAEFGLSDAVITVADEYKDAVKEVIALDAAMKSVTSLDGMKLDEVNAVKAALTALIEDVENIVETPETPETTIIGKLIATASDAWDWTSEVTWTTPDEGTYAELLAACNGKDVDGATFDAAYVVSTEQLLQVTDMGDVTVAFKWTGGNHRIDVLGVDLLKDGAVVYSKYNVGFSGGAGIPVEYKMEDVEAGTYTLRYFSTSQKNNNSKGTITITYSEAVVEPDETIISNLADANPNKAYTVTSVSRGAWAVSEDGKTFTSTGGAAPEAANALHQFAFVTNGDGNYYLWSVSAHAFVLSNMSLSITAFEPIQFNDASSIEEGRVQVQFVGNSNGYINLGGSAQMIVDGWSTKDAGNAVKIVEVADFADLDEALALLNAAIIEEYNEKAAAAEELVSDIETEINDRIEVTEDEQEAVLDAISAVLDYIDSVNGTPTSENIAELQALVDALNAAYNNAIYLNDLSELSNNVAYVVSNARGAWIADVVNETACLNSTTEKEVAKSINDTKQQFAFITSSTGKIYLYNVGEQKFVSKSGSYTALTATPMQAVYFQDGTYAGHPYVVTFDDDWQICISSGYSPDVITEYNDLGDQGNCVRLEPAAEFDPEAALELIADFESIGIYVNELNTIVADIETKVAHIGTTVGLNSTTDAEYATKLAALSEFIAAIDSKTAAEVKEQIEIAKALQATFSIVEPTAGNYYFIKNNPTVWTANDLAVYGDAGAPGWKAFAENNLVFWWKAVEVEGGIAFQNVQTKTYLTGNEGKSGAWTLSETANPIAFAACGYSGDNALVTITLAGWNMHANNHSGGGNVTGSNIVSWNGDAGSASAWVIVDGDAQKLADTYRSTVKAEIDGLAALTGNLGSNYGQYGCNEELKAQIEEFDVENATYDELVAIMDVISEFKGTFKINVPKVGCYLRIKAYSGWNDDARYLASVNSAAQSSRAAFVTDGTEANTIFYYTADSALVSVGSGEYLVSNANFLGYNGIQDAGSKIKFQSATNGALAGYNITFNNGARYLYVNTNDYTDAGSGTNDTNGYVFNLEVVSSIPVTVTSAGYATFYAPVTVTIPEGVEAYYAAGVAGENVTLEQIENTIPANTGVILKADAGTYNFALETVSAAASIEDNLLSGTVRKEVIAKEAAGSYYVLGVVDGVVGMYNPVKGEDGDSFINAGHKAYMYVEGAASSAGYRFDFGGTTGINEVETEESDLVIYDLTGRRVNEMNRPGIYIVNGKKVLVK